MAVRLLLDENLSQRLLPRLADLFPDSTHVRSLGQAGASDQSMWEMARTGEFILLTRDEDLVRLSVLRGAPPRVIWLNVGNARNAAIESLLRASVSVAGVRRGRGASWGESMVLARGVKECFSLIQRLGYTLYPSGKSLLNAVPTWIVAAVLCSVSRIASFRELSATGIIECHSPVDVMVAVAPRANLPVSVAYNSGDEAIRRPFSGVHVHISPT